jgi:hypothetical protein
MIVLEGSVVKGALLLDEDGEIRAKGVFKIRLVYDMSTCMQTVLVLSVSGLLRVIR